jgi:hypothetical protein
MNFTEYTNLEVKNNRACLHEKNHRLSSLK